MGKKSASGTDIAIIGMACWYPGARNLIQNWENILAKRRQYRRILDKRLPLSDYYDPKKSTPDKTYGKYACYIDGFEFDWIGRRVPKSAFDSTDIVHWLALDVATKAIDDAGLDLKTASTSSIGVIVGNSLTGEWSRSNSLRMRWPYVARALRASAKKRGLSQPEIEALIQTMEPIFKSAFPPITEDTLAGNLSNTIAGRIANVLDLAGGGYTVDGACSSSLIAVVTAANHLVNRQMNTALAGGVDISLDTVELIGFAKVGALTEADMKVYDRTASGFIPGEGSGFVVLKRLEDAVRDGNKIYAVLKGWGISSDGKGGITAPTVIGQSIALERAYEQAGYPLSACQFIEGHGTGTSVGDRIEIEGVALTMNHCKHARPRQTGMTSFKSIVGHTKAAAGIGAFIKTVTAVNRRVLPAVAGTDTPNPVFDNGYRHLYPILTGEVKSPTETLRAGVSAMGFGGINCHVTVESYGKPMRNLETSIPERALLVSNEDAEVFILSANTLEALKIQVEGLLAEVPHISEAEVLDLAAELARKNNSEAKYKAALIARTSEQLVNRLSILLQLVSKPLAEGKVHEDPEKNVWVGNSVQKRKIAFIYPGQGAQKLNMAREIVERFGWAQKLMANCGQWLKATPASELEKLMFRRLERAVDPKKIDDWNSKLAQTEIAQPAICLASLLWTKRLNKLGLFPVVTGGHSLGELTAFYCAGAFDEHELLSLASLRGSLMSAPREDAGAMASLSCSLEDANAILSQISDYAVVANINSPTQIVVSGTQAGIGEVIQLSLAQGIACQKLNVSNAFHSKMVSEAAKQIVKLAELPESPRELTTKLFSCMTSKRVDSKIDLKEHFSNQIISQVDFVSMIRAMAKECDIFIEVGPSQILSGLISKILGDKGPQCLPVEPRPGQSAGFKRMIGICYVNGINFKWDEVYKNRLVRPYISPLTRVFLENPCERPFPKHLLEEDHRSAGPAIAISQEGPVKPAVKGALEVVKAEPASAPEVTAPVMAKVSGSLKANSHVETLFEMIEEMTAFPKASLTLEHRFLDDLNLDSIKAGELVAKYSARMGIEGKLDPSQFANATVQQLLNAIAEFKNVDVIESVHPSPAANVPTHTGPSRADILFGLIEEMTSFPRSALTTNHKLLDDLNLDSIKAGELVLKFAGQIGAEGKLDPSQFANSTIQQLLDAVANLGPIASTHNEPAKKENRILNLIMENAKKVSGFPGEVIRPDADLVSDLGMKPHHVWEVISRTASDLSIESGLDRESIVQASRTFRKMAEIVESIYASERTSSNNAEPETNWVHNFALEFRKVPRSQVPDQRAKRKIDQWNSAKVMILADIEESQFGEELGNEIKSRGGSVDIVKFGTLEAESIKPFSHVIALLNSTPGKKIKSELRLKNIIERLRFMAQIPAADLGSRRYTTICFVQFSGGRFGEGAFEYDQCCAKAFGASLSMERHDRIRIIDVPPVKNNPELIANIVEEINTPEIYKAVGFDANGERLIPIPVMQHPSDYTDRGITWSRKDVILVTGGARGITAECVLAFAKQTGISLALVGSTPLNGTDHEKIAEIQKNLERFKGEKINCRYFACDTSNEQAVEELIANVTSQLGEITGVVHGAGVNKPRAAMQVSSEEALRETAPKILSAVNICKKLNAANLKIMVGFTSIIGITGMPGNAWYGFSNEALHLILRKFRAANPQVPIVSVAYSVWDEVGMGARMGSIKTLAKKGIGAIPPADGTQRFVDLILKDPGHDQVIVSARLGGLPTWTSEEFSTAGFRFLEKIQAGIPGIELTVRTKLTLERDKYLNDHNFNGSYLFPTVFGLEAMAQAALCLAGHPVVDCFEFCDVLLERPIVADAKNGVEIEIYAKMLEEKEGDFLKCRVGIRAEQTGFKKDHFSSVLVFEKNPKTSKMEAVTGQPLDIQPATDLYGPYLFQGRMFQKLEKIYSLSSRECLYSLNVADKAMATHLGPEFEYPVLGDAFIRDSLLQSGQAIIPRVNCLPIRIDKWKILKPRGSTKRFAKTILTQETDKSLFVDIESWDETNQLVESLGQYELRILSQRQNAPIAEELANPDLRDASRIQEFLIKMAQEYKFVCPKISILNYLHFGKVERTKRHEIESKCIRELINAEGVKEVRIDWEDSGKPVIHGETKYGVSISHDDRTCLFVVGSGEQGCDLQPVEQREANIWDNLIGEAGKSAFKELSKAEDLNRAATRIWTVIEAVKKASQQNVSSISIVASKDSTYLFKAKVKDASYDVVCFPFTFTRGLERMVSVVVDLTGESAIQPLPTRPQEARKLDYTFKTDEIYKMRIIENNKVISLRSPITFRDVRTVSQTVHFSTYFEWMGKIRELGLFPISEVMSKYLGTGDWAAITNDVQLNIYEDFTISNLSDCLFWQSALTGPEKNIMNLHWHWRKIDAKGRSVHVATALMRACWAKVVGHGIARSTPWPDDLNRAISGMCYDYNPPAPTEPINKIDLGKQLFHLASDPNKRIPLEEHFLRTTLEESNVVGNIYFANYEKWMGQVFDYYFQKVFPSAYDRSWGGEFLCNKLSIQHMRDAMPFDNIQIRMSLRGIYERGFVVYFEFYRQGEKGYERLAHAEFEAIWSKSGAPRRSAEMLPEQILKHLLGLTQNNADSKVAA